MGQVHQVRREENTGFKLVNQPAAPSWRSPARFRRKIERANTRPVLMGLSSACALCLFLPDKFDYGRAISFQLAEGAISAHLLFILMFATLFYVGARLLVWKRYAGALLALLVIGLLTVIAATNARSQLHNGTFVALTAVLAMAHIYAWRISVDFRILLTGAACLVGAALCPMNLGLAERIIIFASCLTLNILILEHVD